jgi:DNA-binding MarR family transcriptional regulator
MSLSAINQFRNIAYGYNLSGAEFAVLSVIAWTTQQKGACDLSVGAIAKNARASKSTVQRAIRSLKAKALLTVTPRRAGGWRYSNRMHITVPSATPSFAGRLSVKAVRWLYEFQPKSREEYAVAVCLALHAEDLRAEISERDICRVIGAGRDKVSQAIRSLIGAGAITRAEGRKRATCRYALVPHDALVFADQLVLTRHPYSGAGGPEVTPGSNRAPDNAVSEPQTNQNQNSQRSENPHPAAQAAALSSCRFSDGSRAADVALSGCTGQSSERGKPEHCCDTGRGSAGAEKAQHEPETQRPAPQGGVKASDGVMARYLHLRGVNGRQIRLGAVPMHSPYTAKHFAGGFGAGYRDLLHELASLWERHPQNEEYPENPETLIRVYVAARRWASFAEIEEGHLWEGEAEGFTEGGAYPQPKKLSNWLHAQRWICAVERRDHLALGQALGTSDLTSEIGF